MTRGKLYMRTVSLLTLVFVAPTWGSIAPPSVPTRLESGLRLYKSLNTAGLLLRLMAAGSAPSERSFFESKVRVLGAQKLPQVMREETEGTTRLRIPDFDFTVQAVPRGESLEVKLNGKPWKLPEPLTAAAVWSDLEREISAKSGGNPFDVIHSLFVPDAQALAVLVATVAAYASVSFVMQSSCATLTKHPACASLWAWPTMAWNWTDARAADAFLKTSLGLSTNQRFCFIEADQPNRKVFLSSTGNALSTKTVIERHAGKTTVRSEGEASTSEVHEFNAQGKLLSSRTVRGEALRLGHGEPELLERWVREESWRKLCTPTKTAFFDIESSLLECQESRQALPATPAVSAGAAQPELLAQLKPWISAVQQQLTAKSFATQFGYYNSSAPNCDRYKSRAGCAERMSALRGCVKQLAADIQDRALKAGVRVTAQGSKGALLNSDGWIEPDKFELKTAQAR